MEEIIRMAQEGNWEGIWLAFQPLILSQALELMGEGVEFEDLRQEGNIALGETIIFYRQTQCSYQWLVLAIQRRVKQRMVRYKRKVCWRAGDRALDVDSYWLESSEAERQFSQRLSKLEIRDMFTRVLTDLEQDVVYARGAGMTQQEIAACLGISPQTMSDDFAEIRRKMRLAFDGKLDEKAPVAETRGRKRKQRGGAV